MLMNNPKNMEKFRPKIPQKQTLEIFDRNGCKIIIDHKWSYHKMSSRGR